MMKGELYVLFGLGVDVDILVAFFFGDVLDILDDIFPQFSRQKLFFKIENF